MATSNTLFMSTAGVSGVAWHAEAKQYRVTLELNPPGGGKPVLLRIPIEDPAAWGAHIGRVVNLQVTLPGEVKLIDRSET